QGRTGSRGPDAARTGARGDPPPGPAAGPAPTRRPGRRRRHADGQRLTARGPTATDGAGPTAADGSGTHGDRRRGDWTHGDRRRGAPRRPTAAGGCGRPRAADGPPPDGETRAARPGAQTAGAVRAPGTPGTPGTAVRRWASRAVRVTPARKPRARGEAPSVSQAGSMSHTATRTVVPDRARGRVCTTVDGKLRTVRATGPRRATSSRGRSGRTTSSPVAPAIRCSLAALSRRC